MRYPHKFLTAVAAATGLMAAFGVADAQTEMQADPASQQAIIVNPSGQEVYFFGDQGNSPETDPAAHLLLIKKQTMVPVATTTTTTTTTTTVAEAPPAPVQEAPVAAAPAPEPEPVAMPAPAPRADRN